MRLKNTVFWLAIFTSVNSAAQDTFSILAFDSITGEVGAAGASCIDLFQYPNPTDFIAELFPGVGAVTTQAAYLPVNQTNARQKMMEGKTPVQLINWLVAHDAESMPQQRQYGVVNMKVGSPKSAAFTGVDCYEYRNHILGANYSIQGNILMGQEVLDSMEAGFQRQQGNLACKLMAALTGAKMIGADARCSFNGTSSLFGFIKVSRSTDPFGKPAFLLSVKTRYGDRIEPIDSLKRMFDRNVNNCFISTVSKQPVTPQTGGFIIYPNPVKGILVIKLLPSETARCIFYDMFGTVLLEQDFTSELRFGTADWTPGVIFVEMQVHNSTYHQKLIIEK